MGKEEHCVPCVVAHYPVGVWLMASTERMGGPGAPTSQKCGAGCSVYRQCVLEGCGSEAGAGPVLRCITQQFSSLSPRCLQTRI
ncbi:hypothetical protein TNCV_3780731 [Trichonephila clavipes]|nr:hypothetical protein TNCV_3780731 [Trichonephila clavipes]